MAQVTAEKQAPKTITLDVSSESYNKGFDDASESCSRPPAPDRYLGHPAQYWEDYAISWMPIVFFLFIYALFIRKYRKRYNKVMDTQQLAYQELQNMNKTLMDISQKLDKK